VAVSRRHAEGLFFDLCEQHGLHGLDLQPLLNALDAPRRGALHADATRVEILERLQSDPYVNTVVRRVCGIKGAVPTRAFLWGLYALGLTRNDEPHVAAVLSGIRENGVSDPEVEVVEPLRQRKGQR
jgi:hypothetical protein